MMFIPGDVSSFWTVFDPVNVIWALCAGFSFGITVLLWATLKFPSSRYVPPHTIFAVTAAISCSAMVAFYASQLGEAIFTGDTQTWRIIARCVLAVMFMVAMSAGLALGHRVAVDSPNTVPPTNGNGNPTPREDYN